MILKLQFDNFPGIKTERLILRQMRDSDAAPMHSMRSEIDVMKYIDRPLSRSEEDALHLIRDNTELVRAGEGIAWAITLKEDDLLIGTIGYWRVTKEHFRGEVGYLLHPGAWGKGIASESLAAVLQFGFEEINFHSIEADVNPENEASIKLLERHGFVREGYFRENYYFEGKFSDSAVYSLLKKK